LLSLLAKRGEASKSVTLIKRRARRRGELSFWRSQNHVFSILKLAPIDPAFRQPIIHKYALPARLCW
jgi:hypothetical protein